MTDPDELIVILDGSEAGLLLHVLAAFERLLRDGALDDHQLRLLMGDMEVATDAAAAIIMAGVVAEAGDPLRRQLG